MSCLKTGDLIWRWSSVKIMIITAARASSQRKAGVKYSGEFDRPTDPTTTKTKKKMMGEILVL